MRVFSRMAVFGLSALVALGGLSVCSSRRSGTTAAGPGLPGGVSHAANIPAKGKATPAVRIGPFYPEAPNGISFIVDHQAAFLLRIGWVQNGRLADGYHAFVADMKGYGPSAAGGGYNRLAWYVG
ncbi:MAG: hypothetical protein ACYCUV_06655 [Phycisphaerae bacterium]